MLISFSKLLISFRKWLISLISLRALLISLRTFMMSLRTLLISLRQLLISLNIFLISLINQIIFSKQLLIFITHKTLWFPQYIFGHPQLRKWARDSRKQIRNVVVQTLNFLWHLFFSSGGCTVARKLDFACSSSSVGPDATKTRSPVPSPSTINNAPGWYQYDVEHLLRGVRLIVVLQ